MTENISVHALIENCGGIENVAVILSVSRYTVCGWIDDNRLPPKRIKDFSTHFHVEPSSILHLV